MQQPAQDVGGKLDAIELLYFFVNHVLVILSLLPCPYQVNSIEVFFVKFLFLIANPLSPTHNFHGYIVSRKFL